MNRQGWFDRQMLRLYDARGLKPNTGQIAEYWRALGSDPQFTETEISLAFDWAVDRAPTPKFGIWDVVVLRQLAVEARAKQRPMPPSAVTARPARPPLPEAPADVAAQGFGALLEFYMGPRPQAEPPPIARPVGPRRPIPEPATERTWRTVGAIADRMLRGGDC